ncbi:MAG: energy transducer TonB [Thermodesulfovibrio sp.]|uniref:energy transducer TonB n=1 Tax=unclassified Thermodesulfovibrio TaxID=2645936 RepID=UPI00083A9E12|nr:MULTISPECIES: energy transducer TonB [unclassified Thermodesulfovibrio]MDI1472121.1 energy transducer TonB [Thermodesulfovibrio sp. 1176]MDI6714918.1 energy transducer TonB [Thermodesulfovibrio sp.]
MTTKIYSSLFLSIIFHSLFILLLIFGIRNSTHDLKNITYITLIQESINKSITNSNLQNTEKNEIAKLNPIVKQKEKINEKKIKSDEELLEERLSAIRAKKRIQEIAISNSLKSNTASSTNKPDSNELLSSYLAIISGLIRQNWNIPDTVPKNLEAVVAVRILSNGQVIIEGFEKSSGNTIFDSSVIRAIKKSSPLPPPKSEVIVGMRFKP